MRLFKLQLTKLPQLSQAVKYEVFVSPTTNKIDNVVF